jgi:hypothetical protein
MMALIQIKLSPQALLTSQALLASAVESRRKRIDMRAEALPSGRAIAFRRGRTLRIAALALSVLPWSQAKSQVTLDVSKITCDQFTGYKITSPNNIALWLHGYFNGRRGNTIIDTQKLNANSNKLLQYCLTKPETPVMQAVTKVFGKNK